MSGVSRRYPALVQLATLLEETLGMLRDAVQRLSKGGVSGDLQVLEGVSKKLRAPEMLVLLENLQTEINLESTQDDAARHLSVPADNESEAQTVQTDALGLRDRQVVAQALDIVVLFEVVPRLFPGVGVPVAQRSSSRKEVVDVVTRLLQQRDVRGEDESLGFIAKRLVGIFDSGKERSSGDVAAVLAAKHTPDLLAALLQTAYAPEGVPADAHYYVERDPERRVELRRAFTRVFDNTGAYLLLESLTSLLNAAASANGGPRWFRTLCGRFLSRVLMRPNGVRIAADFLVGNDPELTTDKLHRISDLLLTPPAGMPPSEYYEHVLPQVLQMADIPRRGAEEAETGLVADIMDTQAVNARIVQAAVYALCRLADKDRAAFTTYVATPVVAPLMRCFDTRELPVRPSAADDAIGDAIGVALRGKPAHKPRIEVIGSDSTSEPEPVVSLAAELVAALDGIQRLVLGGGVPSAAMLSALVVPAFAPLLRWLAFELESEDGGSRAGALRELLASTLAHLPRAAAISTVLGAVQTTFGPSQNDTGDWPVFVRGKAGSATLAWKKPGEGPEEDEAAAQRCVPVEALLDVLASDQVRSIIGDVFMTLLREQGALLDLLRGGVADDSLPRKWWLVSQTTMAMVDSLGPRVLANHVDVLSFVLAAMQKESDDDNEGAEMLLTALVLLVQMMDASQETAFAALASSMGELGRDAGPVADPSMPPIVWDEVALGLLRRIYAQAKRLAEDSAVSAVVAKQASSAKLQIALVLALHGETPSSKEPAAAAFEPDSVDVTRFNTAIRDVRSDLVPVQAHGIIELRNMVLAKSPALVSTERLDAVIAVFTEMARSPDSYIYLNAIRGLAAMADAHGSRFVPLLAQMYTDQEVPLEDRLRVGEALQMTISRAGPTLAQYAEHVVPRLLAAIDFSADEEEVVTHSALAVLAAVARACPLALQKWIAEIASTIDTILMLSAAPPVVRRAAVVVWVDLLRGYGDRLLRLIDAHVLRDAYRSLRRVAESDEDELARLHAMQGIEELDDVMKGQSIEPNYL
ncbi:hypothetical protein GGI20_005087 [Coemansia sp. BCRC 34301]|nr:hypothetical protein GGI20_005087 [Coemansia sp. BCRC 34301]